MSHKMTDQDYADASSALIDWFESQGISPEDAPRVLTVTLVGLIFTLAARNGSDAKVGGKIIAMTTFHWYRANSDGTADRFDDSPAICARIDAGEPGWFATPEGAILHGGVIATAFTLKTEKYMNAALWLKTNGRERVVVGERVILTVTAP